MRYTVSDIARALDAELFGDGTVVIDGAAEPGEAGPTELAMAMSPKYAEDLAKGSARAAVLWADADWTAYDLDAAIRVPRARYAMSGVTRLLDPGPDIPAGIHHFADIDPSARIGPGVAIGPFVSVGRNVVIGANARIASHVSIAEGTRIGDDALILHGVHIGARVRIGDRFIAQPGSVIGADGFSFVTPEKSRVESARESLGRDVDAAAQSWVRIHSIGTVEIGDDVEIGAGSTVDRGTVRATRIGRGTKLDNLVQIGHNVIVGEDALICSQAGVAGSTRIGDRVVLGGKVGVSDNIFVGDDVVAGGGSIILSKTPAGRVVLGYPAMKMEQFLEASRNWRRLAQLVEDVRALKKRVSKDEATE